MEDLDCVDIRDFKESKTDSCDVLRPDAIWNLNSDGKLLQCVEHAKVRQKSHKSNDCKVCMQCAYCSPRWAGCWKTHLPRKEVKANLKAKVNVPEVQAWLNKRDDVNTKTSDGKKETIYLKHYMDIVPVTTMSASLIIAPLKRKCVEALAGDAYLNEGEGNPEPRTAEEINRLEKLNEILYPSQPKQQKKNPTTMEDVRMGGNTSTIKALRSYLTKVLDVLVPAAGKEALTYVLENDRSRHTSSASRGLTHTVKRAKNM
jgi:hypothetical protein